MMVSYQAPDICPIGHLIKEQVRQHISSNFNRIACRLVGKDMDNSQLSAQMSSCNDSSQRLPAHVLEGSTTAFAVIVHDLDIIRAFRDAGVNKLLSLLGSIDGWDGEPELGAMTAGRSDHCPCGAQVGEISSLACRLLLFHALRQALIRKHIQFRGHSKDQRLL
jgi:hypothetical protein